MKKAIVQLLIVFAILYGLLHLFIILGPQEAAVKYAEADIEVPRAPADAKMVSNPLPKTPEVITQGKEIFHGKGSCYVCHGENGKGDGPAGLELNPRPRNFTNPRFHEIRTDGELFWVIKNGSANTRMISFVPSMITEEEAWAVIRYVRTLSVPNPPTASKLPGNS
ncbi:MAG TPA: cytochrome c [Nitrospiria bacterium]|nr:cytochrome c [Nitrospiria bacterium]